MKRQEARWTFIKEKRSNKPRERKEKRNNGTKGVSSGLGAGGGEERPPPRRCAPGINERRAGDYGGGIHARHSLTQQ